MVHPFNQPSTWAGHASLVGELTSQLTERPACLVTSVGGGGLALGLLQGLDTNHWGEVPLLTMETTGANCLLASRRAGHSVTLPRISSLATSLGALTVAPALLEICLRQVTSHILPIILPPSTHHLSLNDVEVAGVSIMFEL